MYRSGTPFGTLGQVSDLSESHLYSCLGQRSCDAGWWVDTGALTAVSGGVYNEECLPYSDSQPSCNIGCSARQNWVKNGTGSVSAVALNTWEAIKSHIVNYGPVSVGFTVHSDFPGFSDAASVTFGPDFVYPGTKTGNVLGGHAVMCYGFDDNMLNGQTATSTGVLFCRNSWNTWWGDQGHFKIAYGADGIMAGNGDSYGFIWNPAPILPPAPVAPAVAPAVATTTTTVAPKPTKAPVQPRYNLQAGNCQTGTTQITCAPSPGTFLSVKKVFYGRDVVGKSSSFTGGCKAPRRTLRSNAYCGGDRTPVWRSCNGFTTCSGSVNDATMGKTACAANIWKIARVTYDCLPIESFTGSGAPRRFGGSRKLRANRRNRNN